MMQNHVDAADSNDVGSNSSSNNAKAVNQSRGHSSSTSSNSSLRPTIPAKPSNLRKDHGIGTSGGGGGGGGIGAKNKLKQHLQQQQHDHQNDEVNHERNKIELSRKKEGRQGRGDEENTRDEMCVYTHELVIVFAASTAMCCLLCMPRYDSLPFFVAHRGEREREPVRVSECVYVRCVLILRYSFSLPRQHRVRIGRNGKLYY